MQRQVVARYCDGALVPERKLHLKEGSTVMLTVAPLDKFGPLRDHVAFHCCAVDVLSLSFAWMITMQERLACDIAEFVLTLEFSGQQKVVTHVALTPDSSRMSCKVALPAFDSATTVTASLAYVDRRRKRYPVDSMLLRIPGVRVLLCDRSDGEAAVFERDGEWTRLADGVWYDSSYGKYSNNANWSLTSPLIALGDSEQTTLSFEEWHDLEECSDFCFLEVQSEDGPWERLYSYSGVCTTWTECRFDLSRFDGTRIRIRFRLVTDRSVTRDGFQMRNLVIAAVKS